MNDENRNILGKLKPYDVLRGSRVSFNICDGWSIENHGEYYVLIPHEDGRFRVVPIAKSYAELEGVSLDPLNIDNMVYDSRVAYPAIDAMLELDSMQFTKIGSLKSRMVFIRQGKIKENLEMSFGKQLQAQ